MADHFVQPTLRQPSADQCAFNCLGDEFWVILAFQLYQTMTPLSDAFIQIDPALYSELRLICRSTVDFALCTMHKRDP